MREIILTSVRNALAKPNGSRKVTVRWKHHAISGLDYFLDLHFNKMIRLTDKDAAKLVGATAYGWGKTDRTMDIEFTEKFDEKFHGVELFTGQLAYSIEHISYP